MAFFYRQAAPGRKFIAEKGCDTGFQRNWFALDRELGILWRQDLPLPGIGDRQLQPRKFCNWPYLEVIKPCEVADVILLEINPLKNIRLSIEQMG